MTILAERLSRLDEDDLTALCEAATAAILDGNGFGWLTAPAPSSLARYFQGLLLVPEANLFVVRENGLIQGAAVLTRPPRNNEAQAMSAQLSGIHIAPYARGRGLGRRLAEAVIASATSMGCKVLNCDVRETQTHAIALFTSLGFQHWGTHPYYARSGSELIPGRFMAKLLTAAPPTPPYMKEMPPVTQPQCRPLILYPAIDLKDGACVRLRRGEMDEATEYSDNPAAQAQSFIDGGCSHLHVVDLNGAFAGRSANIDAVKAILSVATVPVQLGGGIRDMDAIVRWIDAGVSRIILGSVAVKDPELVRAAARRFPGQIVAGIDARQGRVATEGWAEVSEMKATDLALRMQDSGVAAVIFTEITRDGMLSGLDLEQTADLAERLSIPVIASGGVGDIEHLVALRAVADRVPGIAGVITGRALYDGRIALTDALRILKGD